MILCFHFTQQSFTEYIITLLAGWLLELNGDFNTILLCFQDYNISYKRAFLTMSVIFMIAE